jgi:hypothetical protein
MGFLDDFDEKVEKAIKYKVEQKFIEEENKKLKYEDDEKLMGNWEKELLHFSNKFNKYFIVKNYLKWKGSKRLKQEIWDNDQLILEVYICIRDIYEDDKNPFKKGQYEPAIEIIYKNNGVSYTRYYSSATHALEEIAEYLKTYLVAKVK